MAIKFTSWSPSRLADYERCPRFAKFKYLDLLCPSCFKGKLFGAFGKTKTCDSCGAEQEDPPPFKRGSEIGASLENYVNGKSKRLHEEIRHAEVIAIAKMLRKEHARKMVQTELSIVLNEKWEPVSQYTKGAWFRGKLDVYWQASAKAAVVIDWKTGGIDRSTGMVKASEKYDDQLTAYATSALIRFPVLDMVEARLVFVDCGPRFNPVVERKECNLERKDLPAVKKEWERRVLPMFHDRMFAPKANEGCRWCDFSKGKGGPCQF